MKTLPVGEFKTHFSEVLEDIKKGDEVAISYGKKKEKIAVLVPYAKYAGKSTRTIGILEKKASYRISDDFTIADEDLFDL